MKSDDADIFFSGALLGFDESSRAVKTDDETPSDFRIQSTAMASLLYPADCQRCGAISFQIVDWYLSMRLTHATTSWLEGLDGLSRLMTPELI